MAAKAAGGRTATTPQASDSSVTILINLLLTQVTSGYARSNCHAMRASRFGRSNVLSISVLEDPFLQLPPTGIGKCEKKTHITKLHVLSIVCQTHYRP